MPPTARCAMTTPKAIAKPPQAGGRFRLPDIPEREPDEVTQFDHLFKHGNSHHLAVHLGNPDTTLVEADRWIVPDAEFDKTRARYPDLLVAFDVDPDAYEASNGYIVSEQGKPPDFVLEVASASTAQRDLNVKRDYYESVGVLEYWLFDRTGEYYGTRLAGFRLENGGYVPIDVGELPGGSLQGYSGALGVHLRAEHEELVFYDPATGQRVRTYEDQQARADNAEARADNAEAELSLEREARVTEQARADSEREARVTEQARADSEQQARLAAEARVRELEERLHQQSP